MSNLQRTVVMNRLIVFTVTFLIPFTAFAQLEPDLLGQAEQARDAAQMAGGEIYAPNLQEEARSRIRFAEANWNAGKRDMREQARLQAEQGLWAARAALARSQWLSTNAALRSLQADIIRLGGRADVALHDEPPVVLLDRGTTSRARVDFAQAAIDQAKAAGAEQIHGHELDRAQENLGTARKIVRANARSESADHLSYVAEMIARRAYYLARAAEAGRLVAPLQIDRTRLAQAAAETQAATERARLEEAQRQAADLQRQLAVEQANREAQAVEVARLRQQVEENRRLLEERVEQDRLARMEAQRQLDEAVKRYQSAIGTASAAEIESLRRQVEDQQIALRAIQERERLNELSMSAEIESLRKELDMARQQGSANAQLLAERQAELQRREEEFQRLRQQREAELARRMELELQQQAAIAEAQRRRQELEMQAQQLERQVVAAQQEAQQAQAQLQQAQAELERARQEIAQREAEARRIRMEAELSRLAATRRDTRGLIVTLPGIFFDTGKSDLKAGARNTLTKIAEQLRGDEQLRIAVEGHTDSVGSEEANQRLSQRRADAVRDFLLSAGLPAERVTASGMGERAPLATNQTASGRQQNRRVELIITNR